MSAPSGAPCCRPPCCCPSCRCWPLCCCGGVCSYSSSGRFDPGWRPCRSPGCGPRCCVPCCRGPLARCLLAACCTAQRTCNNCSARDCHAHGAREGLSPTSTLATGLVAATSKDAGSLVSSGSSCGGLTQATTVSAAGQDRLASPTKLLPPRNSATTSPGCSAAAISTSMHPCLAYSTGSWCRVTTVHPAGGALRRPHDSGMVYSPTVTVPACTAACAASLAASLSCTVTVIVSRYPLLVVCWAAHKVVLLGCCSPTLNNML